MTEEKKIEATILELLLERGPGKSICPSEVARKIYPENWREQMEKIRQVARALVEKKQIIVTKKDQEVDPGIVKGPIRLRLKGPG